MSLPSLNTRYCELCRCNVQAETFGQHISNLHARDIGDWPGGVAGLLRTLQESLSMSIIKSDSTATKQNMRASKELIYQLEQMLLRHN